MKPRSCSNQTAPFLSHFDEFTMSLYAQPLPATKLGRHRQLAPNAGVHVSPIALGGMSIGDAWSSTMKMGVMDKEASFKLLDAYFDAGGNFIDTANN